VCFLSGLNRIASRNNFISTPLPPTFIIFVTDVRNYQWPTVWRLERRYDDTDSNDVWVW